MGRVYIYILARDRISNKGEKMKTINTEHSMFFRFYGRTVDEISEFYDSLIVDFSLDGDIVGCIVEPISLSVNVIVPKDSRELTVYFSSKEALERFRSREDAKKFYLDRATKVKGAEFVDRKKGDTAYKI